MELNSVERVVLASVLQRSAHQLAIVQSGAVAPQVQVYEGRMELNSVERVVLASVLQRSAHQLAIVQSGEVAPQAQLFFKPLMQRINDCGNSKIFNSETLELTEVAYELLEPLMLNKVRFFTQSVLEDLRSEILAEGSMNSLEDVLRLEHDCRAESIQLIEETMKYTTEVSINENRIKEVSLKSCEEINQKEIQLAMLQDELLDLQYHKEVSLRLAEQRTGAKLSQVSLWLQDHEHLLTQTIHFNNAACDLQDRVHVEILNYLDCVIQDLKKELDHWEERSKTEMAEMNSKLDKLQHARCEQSLQLQTLTSLFKKHNEDIKKYLEERAARERKEEMQQHINEMATRIQAWWRGTMVRRHLGPYKQDKKKKPKDKPKKKK